MRKGMFRSQSKFVRLTSPIIAHPALYLCVLNLCISTCRDTLCCEILLHANMSHNGRVIGLLRCKASMYFATVVEDSGGQNSVQAWGMWKRSRDLTVRHRMECHLDLWQKKCFQDLHIYSSLYKAKFWAQYHKYLCSFFLLTWLLPAYGDSS